MRRLYARWRSHAHQVGEQWTTWRRQWEVQRDLEQVVCTSEPLLAGPWCSEVGYEVLYWIPFLRWVIAAYRIAPERVIAVSRGGTSSWYTGIAARYVEIFDHAEPAELAARAAAGKLKQHQFSDLDRSIVERASEALGLSGFPRVLHPSLMFRWFAPFWSGHDTLGFVERHTRFARMAPSDHRPPVPLPREYAAMKFYAARSLPDQPAVRAQLRAIVDSISERLPIVYLDTGLGIDDHVDYPLAANERVVNLKGHLEPATNLAVQTRIVAGAQVFVGTCGSLAWLAPMMGVPTIPVFTDASFLHAHLHVARRVYGRIGAGTFSPLDLNGLIDAGLFIGGDQLVAGRPPS